MDIREIAYIFGKYIPTIKRPVKLTFWDRIKYTFLAIVFYFILSSTYLIGLSDISLKRFEIMSQILAASMGTIISLGIGPIISGMIVFEILVSSGIIKLDLNNPKDRAIFDVLQKIFAIIFILYENFVIVFSGWIIPKDFAPFPIPQLFLWIQLVLGGILLMLLDEFASLYGLIPGISLFIMASVSKVIVVSLLNPLTYQDIPAGRLLAFIVYLVRGDIYNAFLSFLPILSTFLIFFILSYLLQFKVELPFYMRGPMGQMMKYPLPLFYTSNIPVIFAAAFLSVINFIAIGLMNIDFLKPIGEFLNGIVYHKTVLDFIRNPSLIADPIIWLQILIFILYFVIAGVFFSLVWIEISGQNPENLANSLFPYIYLPGMRPNKKFLIDVIKRYVYPTAIVGGAIIGFIAALSDLIGSLARGTSILLLMLIISSFKERIVNYLFQSFTPEEIMKSKNINKLLNLLGIKFKK